MLAIFSLIKQAFLLLPITVAIIPQYINSFNRVQQFMATPDIVPVEQSKSESAEIKIEDASYKWAGAEEPSLKNINLKVSTNKAIVTHF
jgi:ABC-type transport system involved in cytochrome bd biosynthesis fused ATPase/permease subunit